MRASAKAMDGLHAGGNLGVHNILAAAEHSINDKIGIHAILLAAEEEILAGLKWNEDALRTKLTGIIMDNAQRTAERICGTCVEEVKAVLGGHEANCRRSMGNVNRRMSSQNPLSTPISDLRQSMSPRISPQKSMLGGSPAGRSRSASRAPDGEARQSRSASPTRQSQGKSPIRPSVRAIGTRPSVARQSLRKSLAGGSTEAAKHVRRTTAKMIDAIEEYSAEPGSVRAGGKVDAQIYALAEDIMEDVLGPGSNPRSEREEHRIDKAEVAAEYIAALSESMAPEIHDLESSSANGARGSHKSMTAAAQEYLDLLTETVFADLSQEGEGTVSASKLQRETHATVEHILRAPRQSVRSSLRQNGS